MPRAVRNVLACLAVPLAAACSAGWRRVPLATPRDLPQHQQVQVWRGSQATRLEGLVISGDSASGYPFPRPPGCDTCRVAFALAQVDSIRQGDPSTAFWQSVLLGGAFFFGVYVYICHQNNFCGWFD